MSGGKLPGGWVSTTIGDISVKCSQRVPDENEQFIYVDIGSINREIKVIENPQYLIGKDAPSRARKEIKAHDIIVSLTRPNLNAVALVSEKYDEQIASTGFEVIRPALVESRYIFALVRSRHFINSISGLVQGALYPAAKSSDVQSYEFPLPPLAEQKIIAEKLDTLLAQVDNTKARLEQIPQILKRFRQAVLRAAVTGRLIDKDFTNLVTNIGSHVSIDIGNAFKSAEFSEDGIPLLRGQNIEPGALRWDDTKKFPAEKLELFSHLFINENDIILAMDRPIISSGLKLAKAKKSDLPCVLVQRVARFKDYRDLLPEYLYIALSGLDFENYIQPNQTGSDIPHISGKQILNFKCSIPPHDDQHEIVRRVEQLFAYADTIEKQVNNALTRVNSLTQSILAKAFRGELTAQWRAENPSLISGENSAAALLEKIKAERAASGGKKTSRKKA
ncbi:TPA_asm: type I restriction endonuclease subunit S [Salmonella enterica subsp. enterica]|nr:type I restriction endonuclease subunit S [Salmonella enterica subsp. enterica]HAB6310266.1 type I restriction endonuclease subunit S [Salmonella enterica subsp. enterica]